MRMGAAKEMGESCKRSVTCAYACLCICLLMFILVNVIVFDEATVTARIEGEM
jgi:hypothetical protein